MAGRIFVQLYDEPPDIVVVVVGRQPHHQPKGDASILYVFLQICMHM